MTKLTPIEELALATGLLLKTTNLELCPSYLTKLEALRQAIISDFVKSLEPVGWTNEDQISYIEKGGEMMVYPDTFECPIPLYDLSEWSK